MASDAAVQRLVVRHEVLDGQPVVLFVVESDHELGSPQCSADALLTAVGQAVDHAEGLNIGARVFSSALLDGSRNFIEWQRAGRQLVARRQPDELPPSLLAAELLGQSLADYGAHDQRAVVQ